MTKPTITLQVLLRSVEVDLDGNLLRDPIALMTPLMTEVEVSEKVGAVR